MILHHLYYILYIYTRYYRFFIKSYPETMISCSSRLEAAPHATCAEFGQARGLHRGSASAGLSGLDQILRGLCRAQPRRALSNGAVGISSQSDYRAMSGNDYTLHRHNCTIQIKPFLFKHRHTVQTGASKYSRPSAMLRMPAVLTIRT